MEAYPTQRTKSLPRRPKRSRLTLACERCRLKRRKCTTDTPCTHCIKDGMICSKQRRKRVVKFTVPSEESVEFYEFQIRRLSAAVSELYQKLYQTGSCDGLPWPENPQGVHVIVDMLNLPEDDDEPIVEAETSHETENVEVMKRDRSDCTNSGHVSNEYGVLAGNDDAHFLSSPSSSYLSQSSRSSDNTDFSPPCNGDEVPDWSEFPESNLYGDESLDRLLFGTSNNEPSQPPALQDPVHPPDEDWLHGDLPEGANFDSYTGGFDVSLTGPFGMNKSLFDSELSV